MPQDLYQPWPDLILFLPPASITSSCFQVHCTVIAHLYQLSLFLPSLKVPSEMMLLPLHATEVNQVRLVVQQNVPSGFSSNWQKKYGGVVFLPSVLLRLKHFLRNYCKSSRQFSQTQTQPDLQLTEISRAPLTSGRPDLLGQLCSYSVCLFRNEIPVPITSRLGAVQGGICPLQIMQCISFFLLRKISFSTFSLYYQSLTKQIVSGKAPGLSVHSGHVF